MKLSLRTEQEDFNQIDRGAQTAVASTLGKFKELFPELAAKNHFDERLVSVWIERAYILGCIDGCERTVKVFETSNLVKNVSQQK